VVPVVGLDVLGSSIAGDLVHRSDLLREKFQYTAAQRVDADLLAQILASPSAGLKNIPEGAEVRVLLNKVRTTDHWSQADQVARKLLLHRRIQACLFGEVADQQAPVDRVSGRVAGVILAAGGGSRMGHLKQLLEWRGKPLLWYPIQAAKAAGLSPVVVVIGSSADEIRIALRDEQVTWVDNPDWQSGQSSSLIAGLKAVEDFSEAALFFLADMPLISRNLVEALILRHQATLAPIVIPRIKGQRANPVLFDRDTFPALMDLEGDAGGRQLFEVHRPSFLDWEESIFVDVDTPEDLTRLP
jgi:molybdenum cofactor cytidylyltransferase